MIMTSLSSNDNNLLSTISDSTVSHSNASWRDGLLADWTVIIRNRRFPVHRYVLGLGARSSTYFYNQFHFYPAIGSDESVLQLGRALLCTCSSENCNCPATTTVQMEEIDKAVEMYFHHVLEYMYEGTIQFTEDNIACIYAIADFLQIGSLLSCLEDDVFDLINKSNVINILMAAEKFRLHSGVIIRQCVELLAKSFSEFSFEEWSKIPASRLHQIFGHANCVLSTDKIVRCVLRLFRENGSQLSRTDTLVLLLNISEHSFELPGADALYLMTLVEMFSQSQFDRDTRDSHLQSLTTLQNRCCDILAWNFHELPVDSLAALSVTSVLSLLDRDDLRVLNEDQIYEHICHYMEAKPVVSDEETLMIWKRCRFSLLSAETLWKAQTSSAPKNLILVGAILAGAMQKNEPFMNAIPKDISGKMAQRNIVRPLVAMFAEVSDSMMAFVPNDQTVKHLMSNQFVTYPARASVKCDLSLRTVAWRFKISAGNTQGMAIGLVSALNGNLRPSATRLGSATTRSWALHCQTGKKLHNGKSDNYAMECCDGDVIDMVLSYDKRDRGTLTFLKNGKSCGTAFIGIQGQVSPAVTCFKRNQQISMSLCRPTNL